MNEIFVCGRLGGEPELKYTPNGQPVATGLWPGFAADVEDMHGRALLTRQSGAEQCGDLTGRGVVEGKKDSIEHRSLCACR